MAAYEAMLSVMQQQLGGQPLNIISEAADEILAVLKNETIKNAEKKKKEIEQLLNPIPNRVFDQLVLIGRLITNYQDGGNKDRSPLANSDDALDDDFGVAVEFEENEEEEEETDLDIVQQEDEEEEDGVLDANGAATMQMGGGIDDDDMQEANEGMTLNVQDIDAYWLQRKISQAYKQQIDPQQSQKLAEEVLKILADADGRVVETKLLVYLQFNKFNLIKYLLRNLLKIVWCIRLARAEDQEKRKKIEEEMMGLEPDHSAILEQLHATRASAKERNHNNKGYEEVHVPALKPKSLAAGEELVKVFAMPDWAQPAFRGMTHLNRVQSKVYETALFSAENILLCAPTGAGKTNVAMLKILQQIALHTTEDGKSGDRTYTQLVKLLIIDEIHLLHDNRGPILESIVSRTVRQIETTKEQIRLVGLSATLPNYEDVALFLRVDLKKGLFHFDNSYRPVPLAQQYIGITVKKPLQRFQLMNDVCYDKVISQAGKHQILIFVHSRKETAKTARAIRDAALSKDTLSKFLKEDGVSREILQSHTDLVKSTDLKDLLPYGFTIHHAGMVRSDRQLVEELFGDKHVQVLVSTTTLAWGVNLPAHTVIIKDTQIYNPEKGAWTELSSLDVMQMLGRAGRPQYDSYGEGIIITGHGELQYYLSLMNQQLPIESQFVPKLDDQMNAEIVLGTVQNARDACNWLSYTYLYVHMLQNPTLYGLALDALTQDILLEERRANLVHSAATILDKNNLVKYDRKPGYFQVTDLGCIASYYYITHGTIATYNEHLKPTMGDIEFYQLFSLSEEFKYVTVRQDEKMELAKLLDRVPIPIKESLEEPTAKINVLLQAYISQLKLEGLSLTSDMVFITQSAGRLMRALFEIVFKKGWAQLAEKALKLCKIINKRMWSVQMPLRKFHGIPNEILMMLEKKDLAWERYYDMSSQEIGELIRVPTMGRTLHKFIHQLPNLKLAAHVQPITRLVLRVELTITPDFQWEDKVHGFVEPFWVLMEDSNGEYILHYEYIMLKKKYVDKDHTLTFTVPIYEPQPRQYFLRVVSDTWLDENVLVAAPTRSGKTTCAEFAILRNHQKIPEGFTRAMYIAPIEALAKERYNDWKRKFREALGMRVAELTEAMATDLKLHEKGGPILEVIVSRMRYIASQVENKIRIVALSTSLANAKDLGEWIEATSHSLFNFPPGVKPVPLEIHIQGINISNFEARMQAMTKPTYTAIVQHAKDGKPAFVFVPTRKHARLTVVDLITYSSVDSGETLMFFLKCTKVLEPFIDRIKEPMLKETLKYEVVVGVIQNKQDALDYLTWTFMYRRLAQNPNYYNLQGVSHRHLSDYLSELVENTLRDLESSKCVASEDDFELSPLNLSMITSYYYISNTTIERFSSSLTSKTKLKGLLEILASASEYEQLPIQPGEEELIRTLILHQRFSLKNPKYIDLHVKANALLQAHFSRQLVSGSLSSDQQEVVISPSRLLQAMVDVISNNGWLSLALLSVEVSQMVTQGIWERDSMLLQLPHFTKDWAKKYQKSIETVFDLIEMHKNERRKLLQMSESQLNDISRFFDRFPNIDLTYDVLDSDNVRARKEVRVHVTLERDLKGRTEVGPVDAPRYPKAKGEGWWLVVGDTKSNQLLAIKRVTLQRMLKVKLDFNAPAEVGKMTYTLYFMCYLYMGCDQEYSFTIEVKETACLEDNSGRE
ncbi:unnamed protein product [Ilex paraguariensis]|uniref:RNA helicase n=1 Tax=Ilex paraguariensis TaxID=185542 RepID=A0ABC8UTB3_9AQUA